LVALFAVALNSTAQPAPSPSSGEAQEKSATPQEPTGVKDSTDLRSAGNARANLGEEKPSDTLIAAFTGLLVVVGLLQVVILVVHARLFRSGEDTKHKELRAYVTAAVGQAVPQMAIQNGRLRFEGKPSIINMGRTPAYKVSWVARAEILPRPLDANYTFPELPTPPTEGIVLGPMQNMLISGLVGDYVPDQQVDEIRYGRGMGLYVWAKISYFDIFGRKRTTKLAQMITFSDDNKVINVQYPNQHNYSD